MVIEVDVKKDEGCVSDMYYRFIMIGPEGVTRHSKISTPSSGCFAKEVDRDGRFIAYDDNTVKDTETGLMWISDDIRSCPWSSGAEYCENYGVGFYNDWRMPTIDELSTLFDKSKINLHSNHITRLINIDGDCVWASGVAEKQKFAQYSFKSGNKGQRYQKYCRVLPVREVKSEKSNFDGQK